MKNNNQYQALWNSLKSKKGSINSCLAQFQAMVLESARNSDIYKRFACKVTTEVDGKDLPTPIKTLNTQHYAKIKKAYNIGQEITRKTTIKGVETTYTYTRKCSVYDVYRYFYNLTK